MNLLFNNQSVIIIIEPMLITQGAHRCPNNDSTKSSPYSTLRMMSTTSSGRLNQLMRNRFIIQMYLPLKYVKNLRGRTQKDDNESNTVSVIVLHLARLIKFIRQYIL